MSSVNNRKNFNLNDYDIIGFDLDGTLLRYNLNEMVPLEYDLLMQFLVEERHYPKALLERKCNMDFLQKGLIIDTEKGNILKLGENAQILRATHGTKMLSTEEICRIYGPDRQWDISNQFFADPLSTWNGPLSEKLRTLLDCFDMGASQVFAQTIDLIDEMELAKNGCYQSSPYTLWPDILDGLIQIYTPENFANHQSKYFERLRSEPKRYILPTDKSVLDWLRELRKAGKCLFLLTGSNIDFANFTATQTLGSDWQEYFDCVICYAKKPGFFTQHRPYLPVESIEETSDKPISLTAKLTLNRCYLNGNWQQLHATFADKLQKPLNTLKSMYIGDNLIQDVYAPVKHRDLDAVVISEELLADDAAGDGDLYEFRKCIASKFWGPYFYMPSEQGDGVVEGVPTLWASVIKTYSKICVPIIDTLAKVPLGQQILCNNSEGYYPKKPANMR